MKAPSHFRVSSQVSSFVLCPACKSMAQKRERSSLHKWRYRCSPNIFKKHPNGPTILCIDAKPDFPGCSSSCWGFNAGQLKFVASPEPSPSSIFVHKKVLYCPTENWGLRLRIGGFNVTKMSRLVRSKQGLLNSVMCMVLIHIFMRKNIPRRPYAPCNVTTTDYLIRRI